MLINCSPILGALTVGLNYTPVPLVTMGVDYRHGTGNENDVLYSLQLRYQLDKPRLSKLNRRTLKR